MNVLLDKFRDFGEGLSRFTERRVPDSWVICMMLAPIALFWKCSCLAPDRIIPEYKEDAR